MSPTWPVGNYKCYATFMTQILVWNVITFILGVFVLPTLDRFVICCMSPIPPTYLEPSGELILVKSCI